MIELLKAIFVGIVFSGYYFPFEFTFLPGINTKMILAVIGAMLLAIQWIREKEVRINPVFLSVSGLALAFSLFSLFSVVYNDTTDYTYVTYIVKMWVWWAGAYAVLYLIREVHGEVSFRWVFHYMAWVCAVQAILGIIIDNVPVIQDVVDSYILQDIEYLHRTRRLYGIGAYFDTAGIRFSCALLGLGYLLTQKSSNKTWYLLLFFIIAILGNVMSRTTIVGLVISLFYMLFANFSLNILITDAKLRKFIYISLFVVLIVGVTFCCYHSIPTFRTYLQYGLEGFFNWYKTGDWSTGSTDRLQRMLVLPDNPKTWLIGDGWFDNPDDPGSFYKYTDVGYLRFIFYCGAVGLSLFIFFFSSCTYILCKKHKEYTFLFLLFLVLEFVVWIKISTDIFVVYAMFLLLDRYEPISSTVQTSKILKS